MEGWQKIYSTDKPVEIEVAKAALLANNIESVVISKKDSMYTIGEMELYVPVAEVILAQIIITQHNL